MKERQAYQEDVDRLRRGGIPFTERQQAPLLLQILMLEVLLDVRDLLMADRHPERPDRCDASPTDLAGPS